MDEDRNKLADIEMIQQTLSGDLSRNEQQDDSATIVITAVVWWLSDLTFAPNLCPPKYDPIFSPAEDITSAEDSYETNNGSKECPVTEKNSLTSQDVNKEDINNYWVQELNDSVTSVLSNKQLDAAATLVTGPADESVSDNVLDTATDTVSSNGDFEISECPVREKNFPTSPDDGKEDIIKYWLQETNDSVTSVNRIKQLDAAEALQTSPPHESVSNNELDTASGTVFMKAKQALATWMCSAVLGSILTRFAGLEICLISAGVVITAYLQLLLINMSYLYIFVIPATFLIFIAATCQKLWGRSGVKWGNYEKVYELVVITALPYSALLLEVLVRNRVQYGSDNLILSHFFWFLSSALGAAAVMIAMLSIESSPGEAQVVQLLHRTCITVLTTAVHTKAAEWSKEDMVLICTPELVTLLLWFIIPLMHDHADEESMSERWSTSSKQEEEMEKLHEKVKVVEEEKKKVTVDKEEKDSSPYLHHRKSLLPHEQHRHGSFSLAPDSSLTISIPRKIIIATCTVIYMVLTYIVSSAQENEGISRALRVCSISGCLNYFSMQMLQQWPGSATVSDIPVNLLKVFAKICFVAAAAVLVVVISPWWYDFVAFLQTFDFLVGQGIWRFLRCISLDTLCYYLSWTLPKTDGEMEQEQSVGHDRWKSIFGLSWIPLRFAGRMQQKQYVERDREKVKLE